MSTLANADSKPLAETKRSFAQLFDDADQDRIRAELTTFFGPRAEAYLHTYEKMRSATGTRRATPRAWSWPVFFGSFTWFFYRKMYLYGAMLIFLPIIFAYLFGSAGGSVPIIFAVWAKGWYVRAGLERIIKADRLGLTDAERSDYLQRAGGVSVPAGIFAGFVYACLLALVIFAFIARRNIGH